jgi:hypothetical protein
MKAQQDRAVLVEDLPEEFMGWRTLWLAKQGLVPVEAIGDVGDANDCPRAFHESS